MRFLFGIICFIGTFNGAFGQNHTDLLQLKVDVIYLASDLLEGRESGARGEHLAAEYITARFEELGLEPKGDSTWFQSFDFIFKTNPHADKGEPRIGKNVIGYLDNQAETTVVIGAHYDHLGYGHFGSLYDGEPAIHNGADDNASGVACLLYLAKQLKASEAKNNNYLFIGFSGEEMGLYGSKSFLKNATIDTATMNYMINMDMVGRLNKDKILAINGTGTSPVWKPALAKIDIDGIKTKNTESGVGPSDHTSFYLENIPALHFFSGQHLHYHKPTDDSELINYIGLENISKFIIELIEDLDDEGTLAFTKTKDNDERKAAAFKVTLGVMPDYVFDGEGMRIDGVLEDRPAQLAGLERGDVIIQMGAVKVKDIYDYMEGLSKFKKGETASVKVKRGKEIIEKKVKF